MSTALDEAPVPSIELPPDHAVSGTRRTLLGLLACALAATPLRALLTDWSWLVVSWTAMAIVLLPAAILRARRAANALDIWPGIILLVPFLTHVYLPHHAYGSWIPSGGTFHDLSLLMDDLHHTTTSEVAPIHSTAAVRLVVAALFGLLAALVDLVAVVGRRGALAGVPLLVVYTVAGAIPRRHVQWIWFIFAALGYLILLGLDADDELRDWGRRIARSGSPPPRKLPSFSAQRIAVLAIIVGVLLPLLVPGNARNLLSDAFRGGGSGLGGFGAGGSGTSGISPFAALKGQLNRGKPIPLLTVHVDGAGSVQPFYLRSNVLDKFTSNGFVASGHGNEENIGETSFSTEPSGDNGPTVSFRAQITVTGLSGNPPIFAVPQQVSGLDASTGWTAQDQLLLGSSIHRNDVYSENFAQPDPSIAQLQQAPPADRASLSRYLALPSMPAAVTSLVAQLTRSSATGYDRARAISDFFADPANGFQYSTKTDQGDSGNDLVDFLQNRTGFCQQYAAAMAVMLRIAGVPSRVVLGYMHDALSSSGTFTVTTNDAHAWVEAYFPGLGWIPFDPTPTQGLVGGRKMDQLWAPHSYGSTNSPGQARATGTHTSSPVLRGSTAHSSASAPGSAAGAAGAAGGAPLWTPVGVLIIVLLALTPAGVRWLRRQRRMAAARRGDADALWAELSDTAVDLGYVWSAARSPRQVAAWLAADAGRSASALDDLAVAVERRRYGKGADADGGTDLSGELRMVTGELRGRRSGRSRLRAWLWPASLDWGARLRKRLPRPRHRR